MSASQGFQDRALVVGVTAAIVRDVVCAFYKKVRQDEILAPIFGRAIGSNWDHHVEKVCQFWLTATRLAGGYQARNFMPSHMRHESIGAAEVSRWMALFKETLDERCSPEIGEVLLDIAHRMAENIEVGIARRDGTAAKCYRIRSRMHRENLNQPGDIENGISGDHSILKSTASR